tara:strand:- start:20483 stop:21253 length:771 start_codon:yes stop_codon:yes gene_type:complete
MALQKDFLKQLKTHFKLNIYEVKIWTSLLSKGVSSASELAEISGVPRSRCYDILESLEKKGFIMMKIGKPIEYIAIKPEVILDRVKDEIKGSANKVITYMDKIRESEDFRELDLLYKSGIKHIDVTNISKSVVGATNLNKQIKEMVSQAKSHVTFVTTSEGLQRKSKLIRKCLNDLKKKGIEINLYAPYNKTIMKKIEGVKFSDYHASTQFVSIDGKEMMFMITPDSIVPEYEVGVWIKSNFFVSAVGMLFEQSLK